MNLYFESGPHKARTNLRKYRVSFEEAASIFRDLQIVSIIDEDHGDQRIVEAMT